MPWGHEIRQELSSEEEEILVDAVYNKHCVCFIRYKKGMVMRSVRHDLKKRHLPAGVREIRHLVLLTRARFR
jgi:hypothetical protein